MVFYPRSGHKSLSLRKLVFHAGREPDMRAGGQITQRPFQNIYCKYPNLVRTQAEVISDPNYLVPGLFER